MWRNIGRYALGLLTRGRAGFENPTPRGYVVKFTSISTLDDDDFEIPFK